MSYIGQQIIQIADSIKKEENSSQDSNEKNEINIDNKKLEESVLSMLGLQVKGIVDTIVADISNMINTNKRNWIEGYVLSLSRIMKHDLAWKCICAGYAKSGEKPPAKFQKLLGQSSDIVSANASAKKTVF